MHTASLTKQSEAAAETSPAGRFGLSTRRIISVITCFAVCVRRCPTRRPSCLSAFHAGARRRRHDNQLTCLHVLLGDGTVTYLRQISNDTEQNSCLGHHHIMRKRCPLLRRRLVLLPFYHVHLPHPWRKNTHTRTREREA